MTFNRRPFYVSVYDSCIWIRKVQLHIKNKSEYILSHFFSRSLFLDRNVFKKAGYILYTAPCILKFKHLIVQVVFGGGRKHFFPNTTKDPEDGTYGERQDGRDLIQVIIIITIKNNTNSYSFSRG